MKDILGFPDQWDQEKYEEYMNDLKDKKGSYVHEKLLKKNLVLKEE